MYPPPLFPTLTFVESDKRVVDVYTYTYVDMSTPHLLPEFSQQNIESRIFYIAQSIYNLSCVKVDKNNFCFTYVFSSKIRIFQVIHKKLTFRANQVFWRTMHHSDSCELSVC